MPEVPLALVLVFAFIFGINVGSFLNVVVFRVPRACLGVDKPRWSFCPRCRRRLKWFENQPLIGWALLRGRCGGCKLPISLRYPTVELMTGLIWTAAAWAHLGHLPQEWEAALAAFVILSVTISAALIDVDLRILPDRLTIPGMILTPIVVFLAPEVLGGFPISGLASVVEDELQGALSWWGLSACEDLVLAPVRSLAELKGSHWEGRIGSLAASLCGMALGAAAVWSVGFMGSVIFQREAMGFGDVKFMGFLGAAAGPRGAVLTLILACLFGGVFGGLYRLWKRNEGASSIAFGPFLAIGFFFAFLFPRQTEYCLLQWFPRLWAA